MTRRLPRCASCGGSLRDGERAGVRVLLRWDRLPGRPEVGWCGTCYDPAEVMSSDGRRDTLDLLIEIARRGPGRVVAGVAWWKLKPWAAANARARAAAAETVMRPVTRDLGSLPTSGEEIP